MPSNVFFLNDAFEPISAENLGAIDANSEQVRKVYLTNEGSTGVNSLVIKRKRIAGNDGVDYLSIAQDNGSGNPGTYTTDDIFIGDLDASELIPLWLKVALPNSVNPEGNPRQFNLRIEYNGV